MDYYETRRHSIVKLYKELFFLAWRNEFMQYSAYAGEWLREMEKLRDLDGITSATFAEINQVVNFACDILKGFPVVERISTMTLLDRLKQVFLDCEESSATKLGPYSLTDIGNITSILFDSFKKCCTVRDDDEFGDWE